MDASIDAWMTRFAAGAGTEYQWEMTRHGVIRALLHPTERSGDLCPISAQATLEYGAISHYGNVRAAAALQGLTPCLRDVLITAADGSAPDRADYAPIRGRLLRICRLEEASHV